MADEFQSRPILRAGGGQSISAQVLPIAGDLRVPKPDVLSAQPLSAANGARRSKTYSTEGTVSDYLFAKDQIFAALTLSSEELDLYQQIYALLNTRVPKPDLVVYLQARPEVLYKRVKKRDKKYEKSVTFEYLTEVAQAYNQFFFHYDETPLLVVNTSEIDFVASSKDLADLIKEINGMGSGTQHYIPLGSR